MSAKGRKSDYVILAALAVAVAAAFLAMISWGWIRQSEDGGFWLRTSKSASRDGTLACYRLYERLGYRVARSDRPLTDEAIEGVGVLMLIDPVITLSEGECAAIGRWVGRGGVLVCSGGPGRLPWELHRLGPSVRFRPVRSFGKSARTSVALGDRGLPLARDVSALCLETDETVAAGEGSEDGEQGPIERLLRDQKGLRIAGRRLGRGLAVWMADSSFLSNGLLGKADNPVLAANLLAYALGRAPGKRVVFDEYHYGFGGRESGWSVMAGTLVTTAPGWSVLALTAAGLLYLLYRGRRFGTRRSPAPPHRRSKLEYVLSVGATYRAAGANRLTFRLLFDWFLRRAAEQAGLPPSVTSQRLAGALARRSVEQAKRFESLLDECRAAADGPALSSHRLTNLAGQLARMESEIFPRGTGLRPGAFLDHHRRDAGATKIGDLPWT
jgi:hypothetical protein